MSEGKNYIYGEFEFLPASETSCLVCGHPTGNCSPEDQGHVRVIGADVFESLGAQELFIVQEDIHVERRISPFTTAKVLLYAKGKAIPVTEAKKLGLI